MAIAEFLGVYHQVDAPIPALIFAGKLMSLRNYMKIAPPDNFNENKTLVDILAGLQYVHSKGLVHMELTRDTVTVNSHDRFPYNYLPHNYYTVPIPWIYFTAQLKIM